MIFYHPKYYKELVKRKKEFLKQQATSVKPQAPSSKQQAIDETVPHNDIEEATSSEDTSDNHQAPSYKRQDT